MKNAILEQLLSGEGSRRLMLIIVAVYFLIMLIPFKGGVASAILRRVSDFECNHARQRLEKEAAQEEAALKRAANNPNSALYKHIHGIQQNDLSFSEQIEIEQYDIAQQYGFYDSYNNVTPGYIAAKESMIGAYYKRHYMYVAVAWIIILSNSILWLGLLFIALQIINWVNIGFINDRKAENQIEGHNMTNNIDYTNTREHKSIKTDKIINTSGYSMNMSIGQQIVLSDNQIWYVKTDGTPWAAGDSVEVPTGSSINDEYNNILRNITKGRSGVGKIGIRPSPAPV